MIFYAQTSGAIIQNELIDSRRVLRNKLGSKEKAARKIKQILR
jgi:hypothetical protein